MDTKAAAALDEVWALVTARGLAAQLVLLKGGETVVDRAMLCDRDALFWLFSAGKPYLAVLVRRLAELGVVDLDAPVASYWPEFGAHGKERVTVRDVLQHRSTVATAGSRFLDAALMPLWDRSLQRLARAKPRELEPGHTAYGFISFGFILGEVVRRATHRALPEVMRELVFEPLGVRDTYLGLPPEAAGRAVPLRPGNYHFWGAAAFCNRPQTRAAVIPAAGVSATARDLATFYETLRRGGTWGDRHLLQPESVAAMRTLTYGDHRDDFLGTHMRWSEGFQLGGERSVPDDISSFGRRSSPLTFGHNGSNVAIGWVDPDRELVLAYLTAGFGDLRVNLRHMAAVGDAVLRWDDRLRSQPMTER